MARVSFAAPLLVVLLVGCPTPPDSSGGGAPTAAKPGAGAPPDAGGPAAGSPGAGGPPPEPPKDDAAPGGDGPPGDQPPGTPPAGDGAGGPPGDQPPGTPPPGEADAPPQPKDPAERLDKGNAVMSATFEASGTDSVTVKMTLAGGVEQEVGPFPGPCKELARPGALFSLTCKDGLQVRAMPEGGRIVVAKAPPASTTWETVWKEPDPEDGK